MASRLFKSWLLLGGAAAVLCGACLCTPEVTGAPCLTDDNCPRAQYCTDAGTCDLGARVPHDGGILCASGCPDGSFCAGLTCQLLEGNGTACDAGGQCQSTFCVDGVCGNDPCNGCGRCNLGGAAGSCGIAPSGDPGRNPSCAPYLCSGATFACPSTCVSNAQCVNGSSCVDGGCTGQRGNGQPCGTDQDCLSGFCAGGTCCGGRCDGGCESCATSGAPGTCTTDQAGNAGTACAPYLCDGRNPSCPTSCRLDANCTSDAYCDGGACLLKGSGGQPCSSDPGCSTGHCVNGFCCDTACGACGTCMTGACSDLGQGNPGVPSCNPFVCTASSPLCPTQCTLDLECVSTDYCDGGACLARQSNGTACTSASQCASNICSAAGVCCPTSCGPCGNCAGGTCTNRMTGNPGSPSCAPYVCSGINDGCPNGCINDNNCAAADYCDGGACVGKSADGANCTLDSQCQNSHCVAGKCCNTACGPCGTCASGTCSALPVHNPGTPPCAPYLCDGTAVTCPTTCATSNDCVAGNPCTAMHCGKLPLGATCGTGTDCASTFCVGNVCCDAACGPCGTCGGGAGHCTALNGGTAVPACAGYLCDGRVVTCPTTCSTDNGCISADYCQMNSCVAAQGNSSPCTGDPRQCTSGICSTDGHCCSSQCGACGACFTGNCFDAQSGNAGNPSCSPFVCNGQSSSCPVSCSSDMDCIPTDYCSGTTCVPKAANGQGCAGNNQCQSNICFNGTICCSTACGPCGQCNTGNCAAYPRDTPAAACKPYNCDGMDVTCVSNCQNDLDCVGGFYCFNGQCLVQQANGSNCNAADQCISGYCENSTCCQGTCGACGNCANPMGVCNADIQGSPGSPSCSPYVCDGSSTSCPTTCNTNADCVPGDSCDAGACGGLLSDGSPCTASSECQSGICNPFYKDADGDGWGVPPVQMLCGQNVPWFSNKGGDCCDSDPNAHPTQAGWFTSGPDNCGSWDYDCSSTVELEFNSAFAGCNFASVCPMNNYGFPWDGGLISAGWGMAMPPGNQAFRPAFMIPSCGDAGSLVSSCSFFPASACGFQNFVRFSVNTNQLQGCH